MVTKRMAIALILVLIVLGVILCLALADSHSVTLCCSAILPIMLLLSTYLLLHKLYPEGSFVAPTVTGPPFKPPRLA